MLFSLFLICHFIKQHGHQCSYTHLPGYTGKWFSMVDIWKWNWNFNKYYCIRQEFSCSFFKKSPQSSLKLQGFVLIQQRVSRSGMVTLGTHLSILRLSFSYNSHFTILRMWLHLIVMGRRQRKINKVKRKCQLLCLLWKSLPESLLSDFFSYPLAKSETHRYPYTNTGRCSTF